jgi:hypothetical protein
LKSHDGVSGDEVIAQPWGANDSFYGFLPADFDGDGSQDRMIMRNISGATYFIYLRSSDNEPVFVQWGIPTDTPVLGDYDGDGKTDIATRRSQNGSLTWYVRRSSDGQLMVFVWGLPADQ